MAPGYLLNQSWTSPFSRGRHSNLLLSNFWQIFLWWSSFVARYVWFCSLWPLSGKSHTGEGPPSFKKLEKPVRRPKGRQLNKFRSMLFTLIIKIAAWVWDMKEHCVWVHKRIVWAFAMRKIGSGGRNLAWSLIYSIVWKRYKENPEKVNGDYWK